MAPCIFKPSASKTIACLKLVSVSKPSLCPSPTIQTTTPPGFVTRNNSDARFSKFHSCPPYFRKLSYGGLVTVRSTQSQGIVDKISTLSPQKTWFVKSIIKRKPGLSRRAILFRLAPAARRFQALSVLRFSRLWPDSFSVRLFPSSSPGALPFRLLPL